MLATPDPKFIDIAFNVFDQNERDKFLRELLQAALASTHTGNTESVRRVLLAWEYTALWKKEPNVLGELTDEDSSTLGTDWRDFLTSEGV